MNSDTIWCIGFGSVNNKGTYVLFPASKYTNKSITGTYRFKSKEIAQAKIDELNKKKRGNKQ